MPIALSQRLSLVAYTGFAIFWVTASGAACFFGNCLPQLTEKSLTFLLLWIAIGGFIIGVTGITMYQKIEVTGQALIVQRGFTSRKIFWEQAKLFAALNRFDKEGIPTEYELSSLDTLLRWSALYPGPGIVPIPELDKHMNRFSRIFWLLFMREPIYHYWICVE